MEIKGVYLDESHWKWAGSLKDSLSLNVGQPYSAEEADRARKLLLSTGFFRQVEMVAEFFPDGVNLKFELEPFDLISKISIRGNLLILDKEIMTVIKSSVHEIYEGQKAREDLKRILDLYSRKGFFETMADLKTEKDENGWGVEVIFNIREGKPGVIQEIIFEGNHSFTDKELSDHHRLFLFSFYYTDKVEEASERLTSFYRKAGFIETKISAAYETLSSASFPSLTLTKPLKSLTSLIPGEYLGLSIIFRIKEGDRFDIRVAGQQKVSESTLKDMMTFYRSGFFDHYEAEESCEKILDYYRNRGFFHARVDYTLMETEKTVNFIVEEGPRVKIKGIDFTGNDTFSDKDLLKLMKSRPGVTGAKLYNEETLRVDMKKIEAFYLSKGFTRAELKVAETVFSAAGDHGTILISIYEGPQTKINSVNFENFRLFSEARLMEAIARPANDVLDLDWVEQAKQSILDLYARLGYSDCIVQSRVLFSPGREGANITFIVEEGRQHRLGNLLVTGNRQTEAYVITREFFLKKGDFFDPVKIMAGRQRLFELGYFSRVDLIESQTDNGDEKDLVVRVKERKTGKISVGLGYDSEEEARGFIQVGESNLFGTARGLRLKYKLSTIGQRYDIIYKEPWILGFDQDLHINIYDEFREETGYDLKRTGIKFLTDRTLEQFLNLYLVYRYESVDYQDVQESLLKEEEEVIEEFRIGSVQVALSYDRRDNIFNPHRGYYLYGEAELAASFLGSEVRYNKYETQAVWIQPVFRKAELLLSGRVGIAQTFVYAEDIPLSERFFAGGADTVRGYQENTLGPKDSSGNPLGGELSVIGNVEWRFDLLKHLDGTLFYDFGNVWPKPDDFRFGDIRKTVGVGLRYQTPVGPVRLDYGYKLDREPGEDPSRIHFTLGYAF